MRIVRTFRLGRPGTAALALLMCCFVFFQASPGPAAGADTRLIADAGRGTTGLYLAMGGREDAALAPRGASSSSGGQFLAGSFLGALLFGYPYEGLGAVDLAVLAVFALLVTRAVMRRGAVRGDDRFSVNRHNTGQDSDPQARTDADIRRRRTGETPGPDASGNPRDNAWSRKLKGEPEPDARHEDAPAEPPKPRKPLRPTTVRENAAAHWAHYSSQQGPEVPDALIAEGAGVPEGFDVKDFIEGARTLYIRLQTAWGARKLDELETFTTPSMLRTLQSQAAKHPEPVAVDVVLVDALLLGVERKDGEETARVHFNVAMRTGEEQQPSEITEVWTFMRGRDSGGMWRLAGIEPA